MRLERLIHRLGTWPAARLTAAILGVSVVGAAGVVSVMSWLLNGEIRSDYLLTGLVTASLVSLAVAYVVMRMVRMLRDAEQRAVAGSQAKSRFLANMSHEIRTPLNAITGMALQLRRSGLSASQALPLSKLEAASEHLLRVINDILDLSKIEAGKLQLDQTEVHVESLLADVSSMLQVRAQAKGLAWLAEVDMPSLHLVGDATRLQQALLNYASNAVKFTDAGQITLQARLETPIAEGDEQVMLRFEVHDTGSGIAPADLSRLFQAFEQLDAPGTHTHTGTGLGLAITRKLAQMMGGEAGAHSTPGRGSTFWFTARLRRGHGPRTIERAQQARASEALLQTEYAGRRILLVEDEPTNREVAHFLLQELRQVVDTAEDGREAVALAAVHRYDLILMDVQMPHMDGLEATRHIRQLPGGAKVPILAMTANVYADDRARCIEAGMDDLVAKPIEPEAFYAAVLAALIRTDNAVLADAFA